MKKLIAVLTPLTVFVGFLLPLFCQAQTANLTVRELGKDTIDHVVYVEAPGHFRIAAVRGMNYGISEWYDLVNDHDAKLNILHRPDDNEADQGSIFNQVINPGDLIGHILNAKYIFKDAPRSCRIIEQNPVRLILETEYHPMLWHNINLKLTLKTAYTIYLTGRIGIVHSIKSEEKQVIELWRNSTISLGDPSYRFDGVAKGNGTVKGTVITDPSQCWKSDEFAGMQVNFPDWITYEILGNSATELKLGKQLTGGKPASDGSYWINSQNGKYGWLRCSDLQSPYSWQGSVSEYLREYWDPSTPEPYRNWTKASIMLVPKPDNPKQGGQSIHGWDRFKRFYYEHGKFDMNAGETITQFYMIQLGTAGDKLLPDLSDPEAARIHAASYRNPATLEFSSGSAMDPAFDFGRASYKIRAAAGKAAFKITGSPCLKPVFEVKGIPGDSPLKIQVDGKTADAVAARIDGKTVIVQFLSDLESGATIEICSPP